MTILIADDQTSVLTYLAKAVDWEKLGFHQVLFAHNGIECWNLLEQEHPELLILDIRMPFLDGIEILEKIQKNKIMCRTLILSAYNDFSYAQKAISFGVDSYLLKPISLTELYQQVQEAIAKSREDLREAIQSVFFSCSNIKNQDLINYSFIKRSFHVAFIGSKQKESLQIVERHLQEMTSLIPVHTANAALMVFQTDCDKNSADISAVLSPIEQEQGLVLNVASIHSYPINENSDFTRLLNQGLAMLLGAFYKPNCRYFSSVPTYHAPCAATLEQYRDCILTAISESRSEKAIHQKVRLLFDYFKEVPVHPAKLVKVCFTLLISLHDSLATKFQNTESENTDQDLHQLLFECPNINALETVFYEKLLADYFSISQSVTVQPELWLKQLNNYLYEHMDQDLTLEDLSKHFFMNKFELSRRYKIESGESLWTFLTKIRMDRAKKLLANRNYRISEVADAVGYNSATYFSNTFKKCVGISPQQYKEENGG